LLKTQHFNSKVSFILWAPVASS